jgi:hypothetical protein
MTAHSDLDRQLNDFLRDGPDELPYQSFDAVRDRTEQTGQRVVLGPWRFPEMNKILTIGLAAAAVVVAFFVGAQFFGAPENGIGSQTTPTPEPTATPQPSPSPSADDPTDFASLPIGRIDEGGYAFTHLAGVRVLFTASANWERNIPNWIVWSIDDDKATMGAATVDNVVIDPCQPDLGFQEPAVGPTVDDLVTALSELPGLTFSAPADVTQDGHSGVRLDYVPPGELDNCLDESADAILLSVEGSVPPDHGYVSAPTGDGAFSLYIFDVDGTRVVIAAAYTENRREELDAMLASIRFEQP